MEDDLEEYWIFEDPPNPILFERSDDDDGLIYDIFNHGDAYTSPIQA